MSAYIIGISGASGSGKSTLTRALSDIVSATSGKEAKLFSSDDYFFDNLPKMISPADGLEYPNWNSPESFDSASLIRDIKEAAEKTDGFILVEGVTIFCVPELRKMFDYKIYVDASIEMRIYRRIERNVRTTSQSVRDVGEYYLRCARYEERKHSLPSAVYADLHVDNEYGFSAEDIFREIGKTLK